MDIYHFPVDVHPNQLPFIKLDRPGEGGRGSRADGEQSRGREKQYLFRNTFDDSLEVMVNAGHLRY